MLSIPETAYKLKVFDFEGAGWKCQIKNEDRFKYCGVDFVFIRGNTFYIKEELKQLGGRWFPDKKLWAFPETNYLKAIKLLNDYKTTHTKSSSSIKNLYK